MYSEYKWFLIWLIPKSSRNGNNRIEPTMRKGYLQQRGTVKTQRRLRLSAVSSDFSLIARLIEPQTTNRNFGRNVWLMVGV